MVQPQTKGAVRNNVPEKSLSKFREILLYILQARPRTDERVLHKLLYFIDFDYYEKYHEQLIGATYEAHDNGPVPVEFDEFVADMVAKGELAKDGRKPLRKPNLAVLTQREIEHIDAELHRLGGMSAQKISDYSHGDIPWRVAHKHQTLLEYEMTFYRDDEYSVGDYDDDPL